MGYDGIHTGPDDDNAFDPYPEEVPPEDWNPGPDLMENLTKSFRHVRVGDEFRPQDDVKVPVPPVNGQEEDNIPADVEMLTNALYGGDIRATRERVRNDPHIRRILSISALVGAVKDQTEMMCNSHLASLFGLNKRDLLNAGITALLNIGVTKEEIEEAMKYKPA